MKLIVLAVLFLAFNLPGQFLLPNKSDKEELQVFDRTLEKSIFVDKKSVKAGDAFSVLIEVKVKKDWYVYWRTTGGSANPMEFQFTTPPGIELKEILYPYPKYKYDDSIRSATFYNEGTLIYVANFGVSEGIESGEKSIQLLINWQACKDECISPLEDLPVREIKILVDESSVDDTDVMSLKTKAMEKIPQAPPEDWQINAYFVDKVYQGMLDEKPVLQKGVLVSVKTSGKINPLDLQYFSDNKPFGSQANDNQFEMVSENLFEKFVEISDFENLPKKISGVLTYKEDQKVHAYQVESEIKAEKPVAAETKTSLPYRTLGGEVAVKGNDGFFFNLLLAFLGGMILNLMPCVFPVLSIKVMGFVKHAGEGKHKAIQHALVFTFGALLSFWILAGTMLFLKSAASSGNVTWGFQLQNPVVVFITVVVLFLMSLNLFGIFEIGVSLTSAGQLVQGKSGFSGSFFSGILATVVATPCMAPMLGAALTYALTQTATTAMVIFTVICLGMCFPYIVLASSPKLLKFIPKPGAWMETFKQAMGFLMFLAVLWLLESLHKQIAEPDNFYNILFSLVFVAVAAWIYGKYSQFHLAKSTRIKGYFATIIIGGLSLWYGYNKIYDKAVLEWHPYNQQEISKKIAEGTPVFVDFTASWCVTCKINKQVAIYPNAKVFIDKGVYMVKADFTSKDPKLAEILQKFGSSGVPLNLLYDGKNPLPVKFPESYQKSTLLEQLEKITK